MFTKLETLIKLHMPKDFVISSVFVFNSKNYRRCHVLTWIWATRDRALRRLDAWQYIVFTCTCRCVQQSTRSCRISYFQILLQLSLEERQKERKVFVKKLRRMFHVAQANSAATRRSVCLRSQPRCKLYVGNSAAGGSMVLRSCIQSFRLYISTIIHSYKYSEQIILRHNVLM